MEKQETNKKTSNFENLITLNNILKSNELTTIVANISKSKNMLNNFCKNIKNHEQELKKAAQNVKPVEIIQVESVEKKQSAPAVEKVVNTDRVKNFDSDKKKDFSRNQRSVNAYIRGGSGNSYCKEYHRKPSGKEKYCI